MRLEAVWGMLAARVRSNDANARLSRDLAAVQSRQASPPISSEPVPLAARPSAPRLKSGLRRRLAR